MGTPTGGEKVLWQGRPDLRTFARTAFHTRKLAIYFAVLAVIAAAIGNNSAAIFALVAGVVVIAMAYGAAWLAVKNTLYIVTDDRVMMRIGMAVDKRINLPLKKIGAAHLSEHGKGFGDIALEPADSTVLSYLLLWPHARPLKFARPQPMLRAVPDVQALAAKLAEARSHFTAIERAEPTTTVSDQQHSKPELAGAAA